MSEALRIGRRLLMMGGVAVLACPPNARAETTPNAASLVRPGDPILGNPKGSLTIVDFYDVRCPPCRAMDGRLNKLLHADSGIRYVPVDYPILGAASELGARALLAAQMQGKYRPFRAMLLQDSAPPNDAMIEAHAKALSLDWPEFQLDMSGDAVAAHIAANLSRGESLNIQGIPAMFIGDIFVPGELSYADLVSVVAMARRQNNAAKPP